MVEVRGFVKENRASLTSNITGLNRISKILVKRRDALDETLHVRAGGAEQPRTSPGNVKQGTLDTRDNVGELVNAAAGEPGGALCALVSRPHRQLHALDEPWPLGQLRSPADAGDASRGCRSRSTGTLGGLVEVTR